MIICRECNAERQQYPDRWWNQPPRSGQCAACGATKAATIDVTTSEESLAAAKRGKEER